MAGCNGWANYPTWAVHLWLTNDEDHYNECLRTVGDANRQWIQSPRLYLAATLQENIAEHTPLEGSPLAEASVYADLLRYALDSVDWLAVADALIEAHEEVRA